MGTISDPFVGQTIAGKFGVESLIGVGGTGAVYRARQLAAGSVVALKIIRDEAAARAAFTTRFERQAKAASRLVDPAIARILDHGKDEAGHMYIASEYVDGANLFDAMRPEWPVTDDRIVDLLSQVLDAIGKAHDLGIVHGNLKHENILIRSTTDPSGASRQVVTVCDFAAAGFLDAAPSADAAEHALDPDGLFGSPEFMSPEQCRGEPLDLRSDIYSVGVVLYHLLAGRLPFDADTPEEVMSMQVNEAPLPPRRIYPQASAGLQAVCLRALKKQRGERYATALDMRAALRRALGAVYPSTRPPPPATRESTPPPLADAARPVPAVAAALPRGAKSVPAQASPVARPPPQMTPSTSQMARSGMPGDLAWPVEPNRRSHLATRVATGTIAATAVVAAIAVWAKRIEAPRPTPALVVTQFVPVSPPPPPSSVAPTPPTATAAEPPPAAPVAPPTTRAPPKATAHKARATRGERAKAAAARTPAPEATAEAPEVVPVAEPEPPPPPAPSAAPVPVAAPPPPPPPPFDPRSGRVTWKVSEAGGGATTGSVARALSRIAGGWNGCYVNGLRARHERVEGTATVRLTCDDQGRVIGMTLAGFDMPDVASCIRASAMGVTIPNADTGEAWANLAMTFSASE